MFLKSRGLLPILNQGDDEGEVEKPEEEELESMTENIEEDI